MICRYLLGLNMCLVFLSAMLASKCNAYVPPGAFIIQQMAQKYISASTADHVWKAMITKEQKTSHTRPATMKLVQKGLSFVVGEKDPETVPLYFVETQWSCRGKSAPQCSELINDYCKKAGIDTAIISLAMVDNEPAYMVGALPGDYKSPKLWLNKESLLPVKEQKEHEEITWNKWIRDAKSAFPYPRLIRIKKGEEVINIANG